MSRKPTAYFEDTREERRARDIYEFFSEKNLNPNEYYYEITDSGINKSPKFTYVLSKDFNIQLFEVCLATYGIKKKIEINGKRYLMIWKKVV